MTRKDDKPHTNRYMTFPRSDIEDESDRAGQPVTILTDSANT
jgi:hypothetical protein